MPATRCRLFFIWFSAIFVAESSSLGQGQSMLYDVIATHGTDIPGGPLEGGATFELLDAFQGPTFGAPQINATGLIGFETDVRLPGGFTGTPSIWTAPPGGIPIQRFLEGDVEVQGTFPEDTEFRTDSIFPGQFNGLRNVNNSGQIPVSGLIDFQNVPDAPAVFVSQPSGGITVQAQLPVGFDPALLAYSDSGRMIGRGRLPTANDPAQFEAQLSLFSIESDGSLNRIATLGQAAPVTGGMFTFGGFHFGDVVQTNNGLIAFQQPIAGAGIEPFVNDQVIFADLGSGLTPLARAGAAAPMNSGAGPFVSFSSSGSFIGEAPSLNSEGAYTFRATNADGADGHRNGIWLGFADGELNRIARAGDDTSTGVGTINFLRFERPQINAAGDIFFSALTGPDFSNFQSSIWRYDVDNFEFDRLVHSGQAAPGTNGVFETIPEDFVVNAQGQVAFEGVLTLDPGSGITPQNNRGIWTIDQQGNFSLIVRDGTPLVDQNGTDLGIVHDYFFNNGEDIRDFGRVFAGAGSNSDDGRPSGLGDNGELTFGVTLKPDTDGTSPTDAMIIRASFQGQQSVAEFIFNAACSTSDWHSVCADSNWEDQNGVPTGRPPGDEDGTEDVWIEDHMVILSDRAVDIRNLTATGSLDVSQPLRLRDDSSIEDLALGANLIADKRLVLIGENNVWQSGAISGDAASVANGTSEIEVASGAKLSITATDKTLSSNFLTGGSVDQKGGQLTVGGRLTIDTGGLYSIFAGSLTTQSMTVQGAFQKRKAAVPGETPGDVLVEGELHVDGGTIDVDVGTLTIAADGNYTGTGLIAVDGGATLRYLDAFTTVKDSTGFNVNGSGTVELQGGIFAVNEGATAIFDVEGSGGIDTPSTNGLILEDVLVDADGVLRNEGGMTFKKGTIDGGRFVGDEIIGGIENAAGGFLDIAYLDPKTVHGVLQNSGIILHRGAAKLLLDGGTIVNRTGGVYRLLDDGVIESGPDSGTFRNDGGTFRVEAEIDASPLELVVDVPFEMISGMIDVTNRTLVFKKGIESRHSGDIETSVVASPFNFEPRAEVVIQSQPEGDFHANLSGNIRFADIELQQTFKGNVLGSVDFGDRGTLIFEGEMISGSIVFGKASNVTFSTDVGTRFLEFGEDTTATFTRKLSPGGWVIARQQSTIHVADESDLLVQSSDGLRLQGEWTVEDGAAITLGSGATRADAIGGRVSLHGTGSLSPLVSSESLTVTGSLTLLDGAEFSTSREFVNRGSLVVDTTSRLDVGTDFDNSNDATIRGQLAASTLTIEHGSRFFVFGTVTANSLYIEGGSTVLGRGTINGQRFETYGTLSSGESPGTLILNVDEFIQGTTGRIIAEVAGMVAGDEYDQLVISGTAELGGTLQLQFIEGAGGGTFVPDDGAQFEFVTAAGGITGKFDQIVTPSTGLGADVSVAYESGSVLLTVLDTFLVGDYNASGIVEQADLDLVLLNWGNDLADLIAAGWTDDLPEGPIDQAELDRVLLNWGNQFGTLAASSVPEPNSWLLAVGAMVLSFAACPPSLARA